ncbi:phage tail protein [Vagococcus sp. WN89Y]|uniref:phage tail protein n=1 Tax=Vagococcus sp. WN89Y TaxID=3457258 RepID=UPI003FCDCC98
MPAGVPVPWPSATPPQGWLKCNGAAFSASQYPKLALAYPSLTLPDLRGEFIRGWDDGRGVDVGRLMLSNQGDAQRNITGQIDDIYGGSLVPGSQKGAFSRSAVPAASNYYTTSNSGAGRSVVSLRLDGSLVYPVANEARPRNIAFNFIVRAA